ncbi:MAG: protease [Bdellovibrionaceae bacterium]|nr:protease [Pseudobdellovibrionaceae bacterium]|tara:strand:- start:7775 stop:9265 length:1491 start_codon:yes stop_codon:yes gene_type:complete
MRLLSLLIGLSLTWQAHASSEVRNDYLVKADPSAVAEVISNLKERLPKGSQVSDLGVAGWIRVQLSDTMMMTFSSVNAFSAPGIKTFGPNRVIKLWNNWSVKSPEMRAKIMARIQEGGLPDLGGPVPPDNPAIPTTGSGGSGADPNYSNQWGMNQLGVKDAWAANGKGSDQVVVAVIDTGVDYTHEDLVDNMWRNPGETGVDTNGRDKASNGVDDDGNGFVDDVVGWDFASKDNKPYDFTTSVWDMLFGGGNPGHGTHCAGNVAARADNGKGVVGVAPNVKIMAIRFLTEKGQGTTADAVEAVKYGVDNGANVLSNSWGSEGDDPNDPATQALKDVIQYAESHNVLFVAAAGNGHQGNGYDNDSDSRPGVPASYSNENIVSVAAIDEGANLGSFSNWGARTVDLGAPGVKVFSTMVGNKYSDTVIDIPGMMTATWDGTSMAAPHVSGAAALYISKHPGASYKEVKSALLSSVRRTSQLSSKTVSGGQLDVRALMQR